VSKAITLDFVYRVMRIFDGFEGPPRNAVWWRTDEPQYDPLTFLVNCNDLFYWGCADAEVITEENIAGLEQAVADMKAVGAKDDKGRDEDWYDAHLLWVCRVRGMRPQGAYYKHLTQAFWPLFDACGPERTAQIGNPKERPAA
jgi:hypothetical protein